MAIYHLCAQIITRGAGRSSVAAAAYRHRTAMYEEWSGTDHRYEVRGEVAHAELALPDDAPAWLRALVDGRTPDRASEALWNRVEEAETRRDGALAREVNIALPLELTRDEQVALAREFVRETFTSRGQVADWVLHDKPGNPHIHVMLTLRPLTEDGFGAKMVKVRDAVTGEQARTAKGKLAYAKWAGDKADLLAWRAAWAEVANRHLARIGHDVQIDHRSNTDRGIRLTPTIHLGPAGSAIRLKTDVAERDFALDRIRDQNAAALEAEPERVIEAITREKSVFTAQDVAQVIFRQVDDPAQFERIRLKVLQSEDLVTLVPLAQDVRTGGLANSLLYTSKEILEVERALGERAVRMTERRQSGVDARSLDRTIAGPGAAQFRRGGGSVVLSNEQKAAVRYITGPEQLRTVVGFAGAGKSTMLGAARSAWESGHHRVVGAALAGKAAEELTKASGIHARTLASWELAWSKGQDQLRRGDVLVIDEAGMIGSRQLGRVLEEAERRQAKVVLVGDAEQLQPIEAGAAFRAIAERTGYVELRGIRRQGQEWMREASMNLARGEVGEALAAYDARGAVRMSDTVEAARAAVVAGWLEDRAQSGSTLMLAHSNANVEALNRTARDRLLERGELQGEARFQTARGERLFAGGDRVLFLRNDAQLDVKNGMLGTVTAANDGRLAVRLDGDHGAARIVEVDQARYDNLDWGYAATIHKSQGATVERARVLVTSAMDRHLAYVAMTRHRESLVLHVPEAQFREGLAERLSRSGAKETTLDFVGRAEFLERRGYDTPRTVGGAVTALFESQAEWIAKAEERLHALRERLEVAGRAVWDRLVGHRQPSDRAVTPAPAEARRDTSKVGDRVTEIARTTALSSPLYQERADAVRLAAARLYEDHAVAAHRIETQVSRGPEGAVETARQVAEDPAAFGAFRATADRAAAMDALASAVRDQAQAYLIAHGKAVAQARQIERGLDAPPTHEPARTETLPPLFAAVTSFDRTIVQEAEVNVRALPAHKSRADALQRSAEAVYRDPAGAVARIEAALRDGQPENELAGVLQREPGVAGELRGSRRLLDGPGARAERRKAEGAVAELTVVVRYYGQSWRANLKAETERTREGRERLETEVPTLSAEAVTALRTLERLRVDNPGRYSAEAAKLMSRANLNAEIAGFREAVERRFGDHDFRKGIAGVEGRVSAAERNRLAQAASLIAAAQRVGREQVTIRALSLRPGPSRGVSR